MNEWSPRDESADAELELADSLIGKADALLRRHHGTNTPPASAAANEPNDDSDELPILTDVVLDFDESIPLLSEVAQLQQNTLAPAPAAAASQTGLSIQDRALLVEHLVEIDTLIAHEVETWLSNELPQLLSRELDKLNERLRIETLAHLRATLLPTLSAHIASRLDDTER
ncbi:MAG: hypothetical protein CVU19_14870 [Betaproteobacteria bacterium HGW-Betaproteobacteria-13]|jgi:hypothetical protein|uniref:Uncharacterized protein n=1 Tax=Parazoarcus communis TaxID=41977 RepID=A0A2U8H7P3_9RHOO|nr:hypothetical protein [Parazoarcus communis]AWI81761.1 hypothetical protein CEW87_21855 [Parazoarcus communis]PKO80015.1 MAG: hypothetical protein CVU19_14870 [Betaproteobacteria bacterium HGW-Betaproteobacteria-13]